MASLATPSSPTSLQLQFGRRYRGAPSVSIWIRYRVPDCRIRLIPIAGAQASGGGKGGSWSGADASSDSFAGWSGTDSSEGGGDSRKKGGFGGILGVGLAGVFFAAGITFASLSLINKSTSGVKHQMKPLTAEQEVLQTSDDCVKVDQDSNDSSAVLPDKERKIDCNSDCETGINKDPLPPIEISEDATGGGVDNIHHFGTSSVQNIKSTGNGVDAIDNAPNQVVLQISPDALNIPVPSDSNPSSPELSAYGAVDSSSDLSSFKDSSNTISSDTTDSVIRHEANLDTVNHVDLSAYNTDLTNHTIQCLEENLSTEETVNSKASLDFSSEFDGQIPSDISTSSFTLLESRDIVGFDIKDVMETPAYVSEEQDIEHGAMLQLPAETRTLYPVVLDINETVISETLSASDFDKNQPPKLLSETIDSAEGHKLNESASSIAYSVSELSELNVNEQPDISGHNQIERSLSFESVLPERPFSNSGIPAPSLVSAALQVPPGKVLVPAVVDQVQGQALAALQVLKVIEADVQPGDLCTRREYARWLVSASSALSRNPVSKVYPAMYIENVTELAFNDVTPEDPDFPYIQGLAEAGMISSKLSRSDLNDSFSGQQDSYLFSPESPLSRQDLVSWKMALEKRQLPEVDRNDLYTCSGYIDIDKINPDAWPSLVADLSAGEQAITALAFGYTRLFQPNKPVTKAQAAIALATGDAAEVVGEELTRIEAESLAESAVNAHTALVAQVEKDLNASFEKELATEREKIDAVEKLAEEARLELERLRAEREEENNALIMGRAAVESEMEVLSRLRRELEEQLQEFMSNKVEISFERDRINKLRKEAESENRVIVQLQYELEVERKALSMARAWVEDEAKRAREQARALQEARDRWERQGIKVVVDGDLQDDASAGITWVTAGEQQSPVVETINRGESLVEKLRAMAAEIKLRSSGLIEKIIQKIVAVISALKQLACDTSKHAKDLHSGICSKASRSIEELQENASGLRSKASRSIEDFQENASGFSSSVGDKARRVAEDCKESIDKITQKFKT